MRYTRRRRQQRYRLTVEACLVVALLLCIAAFQSGWRPSAEPPPVKPDPAEPLTMVETPPTEHREMAPPPPRPLVPALMPDDVVLPDDEIDFQPVDVDAERPVRESPPPQPPPTNTGPPEPFVSVEQMPAPRDGWAGFYGSLTYPEAARRAGVEGRVVLQFVVDKDGQICDVQVLQSVHPSLDAEAARALREARFAPGRQRNRPVPVRMELPIMFRLRQ